VRDLCRTSEGSRILLLNTVRDYKCWSCRLNSVFLIEQGGGKGNGCQGYWCERILFGELFGRRAEGGFKGGSTGSKGAHPLISCGTRTKGTRPPPCVSLSSLGFSSLGPGWLKVGDSPNMKVRSLFQDWHHVALSAMLLLRLLGSLWDRRINVVRCCASASSEAGVGVVDQAELCKVLWTNRDYATINLTYSIFPLVWNNLTIFFILSAPPSNTNISRHLFSFKWLWICVFVMSSNPCFIAVTMPSTSWLWINRRVELILPDNFSFSLLSAMSILAPVLITSDLPEKPSSSRILSISWSIFSFKDTLIITIVYMVNVN